MRARLASDTAVIKIAYIWWQFLRGALARLSFASRIPLRVLTSANDSVSRSQAIAETRHKHSGKRLLASCAAKRHVLSWEVGLAAASSRPFLAWLGLSRKTGPRTRHRARAGLSFPCSGTAFGLRFRCVCALPLYGSSCVFSSTCILFAVVASTSQSHNWRSAIERLATEPPEVVAAIRAEAASFRRIRIAEDS
jgi:hypothetical protein